MLRSENTNQEFPLIPNQAFRSFPDAVEIKTGTGRKLFMGGLEPDDYERKKLAEFEEYLIKKKKHPLPSFWVPMQRVRFLQSCGYNLDRAYKEMVEHSNWRDKALPPQLTKKTQQYLNSGMFYLCGRDARLRPILVFDIQKIVDMKASTEDLLDTITYFFMYLIDNLLIEGQIETWVSIIDVNMLGLFSFAGDLKKTVGFLSNTFRCRMHSAYIVRTPASVGFLWSIVKKFMEEETIRKISLYDTDKRAEPLFQQANPSQIQKKFGGELQNIKTFWPPRIYSHNYDHKGSSQKLVTKEQYKKRYEAGELKDRKVDMSMIGPVEVVRPRESSKLHHLQSSRQNDRSSQSSPRQSHKFDSQITIKDANGKVNIPTPTPPIMKPLRIEVVQTAPSEHHGEHIPLIAHIHHTKKITSSVRPIGDGLFIATPYSQHIQSFVSGSFSQHDHNQPRGLQNLQPSKISTRSVRSHHYQAPSPTTNDILLEQKLLEIKSLATRKTSSYFK